MLTPFTPEGEVDYAALERLICFYEEGGSDGLFSVCQSSEVFYLSLSERVKIARFVKEHAHVPVVASGHVSWSLDEQIYELNRIAETGVDAVILITNRLAQQKDSPDVWRRSLDKILGSLDPSVALGFYECPMPYKRLVSLEELSYAASTGRFRFMKDTCCDIALIRKRLEVLKSSAMGLYNANTATLLDSLNAGAAGYSGIMANFHPELYAWLLKNFGTQREKAKTVQALLTVCALIEKQLYPVNAKYYLSEVKKLPMSVYSRTQNMHDLSPLFMDEIMQLDRLVESFKRHENL
ncbi:MAG: dihydrodipicolinate synthase family protein [Clostridia bacterium]|nr:dihydrodipicolinate synthase family protein [Clostridia bacterium]